MEKLLIVRGESHIRNTTESDILTSLSPAETAAARRIVDLRTIAFSDAIDGGYWDSLNVHIQNVAGQLLAEANGAEPSKLLYFGIDETPALIALGAYVGDEHRIECRDYDRDTGAFAWPNDSEP